LKLNRKEFLGEIERVKPALGGAGGLAELTHLWFDGDQVQAFNIGLGLCAPLKTDFTGGVPGRLFISLLQSSSAEEIEVGEDGDCLEVVQGKSRTKLPMLAMDRNPWSERFGKPPKSAGCVPLTEELLDALRRVRIVKHKEPNRVEHYGITFMASKEDMRLYTTDSRMLARIVVPGKFEDEDGVLPWAFAEQIIALCEPGARLYLSDDFLMATSNEKDDGPRIYSTVLDASELMDLDGIIANFIVENAASAPLPKGLGESLDRAALLSASSEDPVIQITVKKNTFFLNGRYSKTTEVDESLDLDGKHPEGKITVRVDQLQAAMAQAEEFTIGEALVLRGEKDFLSMIAASSGSK
jgi:hypothetical protein